MPASPTQTQPDEASNEWVRDSFDFSEVGKDIPSSELITKAKEEINAFKADPKNKEKEITMYAYPEYKITGKHPNRPPQGQAIDLLKKK